jgi:hypothetical protein
MLDLKRQFLQRLLSLRELGEWADEELFERYLSENRNPSVLLPALRIETPISIGFR